MSNPVCADLDLWIGAVERLYMRRLRRLGAIHRGFKVYAAGKQCPDVVIPSVETLAQAATEVEGSIEYAKSVMENQKNQ